MIKNKIIDEIQKEDRGISLEKFIDICLFDNEGYYKTSNPLGKSGDFITSPEISQLFGEILGLYIHSLWQNKYKEKSKKRLSNIISTKIKTSFIGAISSCES